MSEQLINEVNRMKNLFGYKKGVVISEQTSQLLFEGVDTDEIVKLLKRASEFSSNRGGTSEQAFSEAIRMIDSIDTYKSVNSKLGGFGVPGLIHDEFDANDKEDQYWINGMRNHLKSIGLEVGNYKNGNIMIKIPVSKTQEPVTKTEPETEVKTPPTSKTQTPEKSKTPAKAAQKTQWTAEPKELDDDKNTLKKGMTGEKIGQLQTFLNIVGKKGQKLVTNNFWTLTDAALKKFYPEEYTTDKGVTKTLFDKIVTLKRKETPAEDILPINQKSDITPTEPKLRISQQMTDYNKNPQEFLKQSFDKMDPNVYYKSLYDAKLIEGEPSQDGDKRVRYRGPELKPEQQEKLTQAMTNLGYEFLRKGNDKRLVYRRK